MRNGAGRGRALRCPFISPWPLAFVPASLGRGLVDGIQPGSESVPAWVGVLSQCSLPRKGSSQCQTLQTLPVVGPQEQAWLHGGRLSQLCSGWMKAPQLQPCHNVPLPKGRPGIPWGSSGSQGHSLSPLGCVLGIWQKSWLTPGKMDGTMPHRVTDFVREGNRQGDKPSITCFSI